MLQSLEIHALRGATKPFVLPFEKGKQITILYGGNGSGKSTICDAIELVTHESVGSLDGKGIGRTSQFWHSTGQRSTDLKVILTTSDGRWEAKVVKAKIVVAPNEPRPKAQILRRNQILGLIAAQPKDRFDAVRLFLDIDAVEASEASLRRLLDQERKGRDIAVARIEENRAAVENFWKESGSQGSDAIAWARVELGRDVRQIQSQVDDLKRTIGAANKVVDEQQRLASAELLFGQAEERYAASSNRVAQEQSHISREAGDLIGVLEAANAYFLNRHDVDACPLCGSAEYVANLPGKIEDNLARIRALRDARRELMESEDLLRSARNQMERQSNSLLETVNAFRNQISLHAASAINASPDFSARAKSIIEQPVDQIAQLQTARQLSEQIPQMIAPLEDALRQRTEEASFYQLLRRAVDMHDENYAAQKDLDLLIPRLEQGLAEMEDVRRQFVDNVLKTIATRVGELYEEIHPGEGLSKVSLLLDPNKRASLEIAVPFPGANDAPPGAYFSESHLDTLGLCIWLALAEMGDTKQTVLVLDDVIASVDEQHAERIVELLYNIAQDFHHCIYTTHYRPWREKYRWGWLNNGQCQFVELMPWQHQTGMRHTRHTPPVEELRGLLAADIPSPQLICSSAGVILEAILDFLTQLYECSVPRRRGKPTLGDLLPSVKGKLRSSLTVERKEIDESGAELLSRYPLAPILDRLDKMAQTRNIFGCHFNDLSMELQDNDAIAFADAVLGLADLLIDVNVGWPKSDKSGWYWANSKDTRRLHPLQQPS
jgi:energy-coupling factor transporter ATP-binding protein EcfA2